MARPAPAVERTVAVLEHLAAHPDEWLSLSELSRRLGISKATAHSTVSALARAGYLLRHPADKTYTLGPALIALGNAAGASRLPALDLAREEMRLLSDDLGVQCVCSAVIGDEIVLLAVTHAGPLGVAVQVGERLPLAPPLGTVFVAWSGPVEIDRWLERLGAGVDPGDLARYRAAVQTVRERGYSVALEADARVRLGQVLADLGRADPAELRRVVQELVEELGHEEYILSELEPARSYRLSHIAAPVFGPDAGVALALTLIGFVGQLGAEEVPGHARRLQRAASAVTAAIHGRSPQKTDVAG